MPSVKATAKQCMFRLLRPGLRDVSGSLGRLEALLSSGTWRGGLAGSAVSPCGTEVPDLTEKYRVELGFWCDFARRASAEQCGGEFQDVFGGWQRARLDELRETLGLPDRAAFEAWTRERTAVEIGAGPFPSIALAPWRRAIAIDPLADGYTTEGLLPPECDSVTYIAAAGEVIPLPARTADLVVIENCLDHADRPRDVLLEARRLLRPGGLLWLLVDLMAYRDKLHPNPFDERGLRDLLAQTGFRVVKDRVSAHKSHPEAYGEYRGLLRTPDA
ncbi:MAG TPA: methyltransferase domain-containing protein [Phycisphaerales bacterium]|nr:methyltransferase domain-containing protein [Phycisphaerales bacterium]